MKMKLWVLWTIILVLCLDTSIALSDTLDPSICAGFDDAVCGNILISSDNITEQKEILLMLIGQGDILPKHDIVQVWNEKLVFSEPPTGVETAFKLCEDDGVTKCISGAWLRTFSVLPSYMELDTNYNDNSGDFQAGFSYNLTTPPDYIRETVCTCGEPPTNPIFPNDCKTIYHNEDLSTLDMAHNGQIRLTGDVVDLGNNVFAEFSTNTGDNDFLSTLNIVNRVFREHWSWVRSGECSTCCESCDCNDPPCGCCEYADIYVCSNYQGKDHVDELITLSNQLDAVLYETPDINHSIIIKGNTTVTTAIVETNALDFTIDMTKGTLTQDKSGYGVTYTYPPYNILWVKKTNTSDWYFEDMQILSTEPVLEFQTYAHNLEKCIFRQNRPFEPFSISDDCNMTIKDTINITISANQSIYLLDETIILEVSLETDSPINATLEYGNNKTNMILSPGDSTISLTPKLSLSTAVLRFHGDETRAPATSNLVQIYVQKRSVFMMVIELGFLFGIIYILYRVYKHVAEGAVSL